MPDEVSLSKKIQNYARINKISDEEAKKALQKEEEKQEEQKQAPQIKTYDADEAIIEEQEYIAMLNELSRQGKLEEIQLQDANGNYLGIKLTVNKTDKYSKFEYTVDGNTVTIKAKKCAMEIVNGDNNSQNASNVDIILDGSNVKLNSNVKVKSITSNAVNAVINGSSEDDIIIANGMNTTVNGRDGNDVILSNGMNSTIRGGEGNDYFDVRGSGSNVHANDGDNSIYVQGQDIFVDTGKGNSETEVHGYNISVDDGTSGNKNIHGDGRDVTVTSGDAANDITLRGMDVKVEYDKETTTYSPNDNISLTNTTTGQTTTNTADTNFNGTTGLNDAGYNSQGYKPVTGEDGTRWENFNGLDMEGLDENGYNAYGYDKEGYNANGVSKDGKTKEQEFSLIDSKLCKNNVPYTGTYKVDNKTYLYKNGVKDITKQDYNGRLFVNGELAKTRQVYNHELYDGGIRQVTNKNTIPQYIQYEEYSNGDVVSCDDEVFDEQNRLISFTRTTNFANNETLEEEYTIEYTDGKFTVTTEYTDTSIRAQVSEEIVYKYQDGTAIVENTTKNLHYYNESAQYTDSFEQKETYYAGRTYVEYRVYNKNSGNNFASLNQYDKNSFPKIYLPTEPNGIYVAFCEFDDDLNDLSENNFGLLVDAQDHVKAMFLSGGQRADVNEHGNITVTNADNSTITYNNSGIPQGFVFGKDGKLYKDGEKHNGIYEAGNKTYLYTQGEKDKREHTDYEGKLFASGELDTERQVWSHELYVAGYKQTGINRDTVGTILNISMTSDTIKDESYNADNKRLESFKVKTGSPEVTTQYTVHYSTGSDPKITDIVASSTGNITTTYVNAAGTAATGIVENKTNDTKIDISGKAAGHTQPDWSVDITKSNIPKFTGLSDQTLNGVKLNFQDSKSITVQSGDFVTYDATEQKIKVTHGTNVTWYNVDGTPYSNNLSTVLELLNISSAIDASPAPTFDDTGKTRIKEFSVTVGTGSNQVTTQYTVHYSTGSDPKITDIVASSTGNITTTYVNAAGTAATGIVENKTNDTKIDISGKAAGHTQPDWSVDITKSNIPKFTGLSDQTLNGVKLNFQDSKSITVQSGDFVTYDATEQKIKVTHGTNVTWYNVDGTPYSNNLSTVLELLNISSAIDASPAPTFDDTGKTRIKEFSVTVGTGSNQVTTQYTVHYSTGSDPKITDIVASSTGNITTTYVNAAGTAATGIVENKTNDTKIDISGKAAGHTQPDWSVDITKSNIPKFTGLSDQTLNGVKLNFQDSKSITVQSGDFVTYDATEQKIKVTHGTNVTWYNVDGSRYADGNDVLPTENRAIIRYILGFNDDVEFTSEVTNSNGNLTEFRISGTTYNVDYTTGDNPKIAKIQYLNDKGGWTQIYAKEDGTTKAGMVECEISSEKVKITAINQSYEDKNWSIEYQPNTLNLSSPPYTDIRLSGITLNFQQVDGDYPTITVGEGDTLTYNNGVIQVVPKNNPTENTTYYTVEGLLANDKIGDITYSQGKKANGVLFAGNGTPWLYKDGIVDENKQLVTYTDTETETEITRLFNEGTIASGLVKNDSEGGNNLWYNNGIPANGKIGDYTYYQGLRTNFEDIIEKLELDAANVTVPDDGYNEEGKLVKFIETHADSVEKNYTVSYQNRNTIIAESYRVAVSSAQNFYNEITTTYTFDDTGNQISSPTIIIDYMQSESGGDTYRFSSSQIGNVFRKYNKENNTDYYTVTNNNMSEFPKLCTKYSSTDPLNIIKFGDYVVSALKYDSATGTFKVNENDIQIKALMVSDNQLVTIDQNGTVTVRNSGNEIIAIYNANGESQDIPSSDNRNDLLEMTGEAAAVAQTGTTLTVIHGDSEKPERVTSMSITDNGGTRTYNIIYDDHDDGDNYIVIKKTASNGTKSTRAYNPNKTPVAKAEIRGRLYTNGDPASGSVSGYSYSYTDGYITSIRNGDIENILTVKPDIDLEDIDNFSLRMGEAANQYYGFDFDANGKSYSYGFIKDIADGFSLAENTEDASIHTGYTSACVRAYENTFNSYGLQLSNTVYGSDGTTVTKTNVIDPNYRADLEFLHDHGGYDGYNVSNLIAPKSERANTLIQFNFSQKTKEDIEVYKLAVAYATEQSNGATDKKAAYNTALNNYINDYLVPTYNSIEEAKENTVTGNVVEVNGKLYVRDGEELVRLQMTKAQYTELFPLIGRYTANQTDLADCYYVAGVLIGLLENPVTFAKILQMMEYDTATPPNLKIKFNGLPDTVTFDEGRLNDMDGIYGYTSHAVKRQVSGSKGLQFLEQAYAIAVFAQEENKNVTSIDIDEALDYIAEGINSEAQNYVLGGNVAGWAILIPPNGTTSGITKQNIIEMYSLIDVLENAESNSAFKSIVDSTDLLFRIRYLSYYYDYYVTGTNNNIWADYYNNNITKEEFVEWVSNAGSSSILSLSDDEINTICSVLKDVNNYPTAAAAYSKNYVTIYNATYKQEPRGVWSAINYPYSREYLLSALNDSKNTTVYAALYAAQNAMLTELFQGMMNGDIVLGIGTSGKELTNKYVYDKHAHAIESYDAQNNTVTIINPYSGGLSVTLTYDEFINTFYEIFFAKLDKLPPVSGGGGEDTHEASQLTSKNAFFDSWTLGETSKEDASAFAYDSADRLISFTYGGKTYNVVYEDDNTDWFMVTSHKDDTTTNVWPQGVYDNTFITKLQTFYYTNLHNNIDVYSNATNSLAGEYKKQDGGIVPRTTEPDPEEAREESRALVEDTVGYSLESAQNLQYDDQNRLVSYTVDDGYDENGITHYIIYNDSNDVDGVLYNKQSLVGDTWVDTTYINNYSGSFPADYTDLDSLKDRVAVTNAVNIPNLKPEDTAIYTKVGDTYSLYEGVRPSDGKMVRNGAPVSGRSDTNHLLYNQGELYNGTYTDGLFYKDGIVFTGRTADKEYRYGMEVIKTESTNGSGNKVITAKLNDKTIYTEEYNAKNQVIEKREYASEDKYAVYTYEYYDNGLLKKVTSDNTNAVLAGEVPSIIVDEITYNENNLISRLQSTMSHNDIDSNMILSITYDDSNKFTQTIETYAYDSGSSGRMHSTAVYSCVLDGENISPQNINAYLLKFYGNIHDEQVWATTNACKIDSTLESLVVKTMDDEYIEDGFLRYMTDGTLNIDELGNFTSERCNFKYVKVPIYNRETDEETAKPIPLQLQYTLSNDYTTYYPTNFDQVTTNASWGGSYLVSVTGYQQSLTYDEYGNITHIYDDGTFREFQDFIYTGYVAAHGENGNVQEWIYNTFDIAKLSLCLLYGPNDGYAPRVSGKITLEEYEQFYNTLLQNNIIDEDGNILDIDAFSTAVAETGVMDKATITTMYNSGITNINTFAAMFVQTDNDDEDMQLKTTALNNLSSQIESLSVLDFPVEISGVGEEGIITDIYSRVLGSNSTVQPQGGFVYVQSANNVELDANNRVISYTSSYLDSVYNYEYDADGYLEKSTFEFTMPYNTNTYLAGRNKVEKIYTRDANHNVTKIELKCYLDDFETETITVNLINNKIVSAESQQNKVTLQEHTYGKDVHQKFTISDEGVFTNMTYDTDTIKYAAISNGDGTSYFKRVQYDDEGNFEGVTVCTAKSTEELSSKWLSSSGLAGGNGSLETIITTDDDLSFAIEMGYDGVALYADGRVSSSERGSYTTGDSEIYKAFWSTNGDEKYKAYELVRNEVYAEYYSNNQLKHIANSDVYDRGQAIVTYINKTPPTIIEDYYEDGQLAAITSNAEGCISYFEDGKLHFVSDNYRFGDWYLGWDFSEDDALGYTGTNFGAGFDPGNYCVYYANGNKKMVRNGSQYAEYYSSGQVSLKTDDNYRCEYWENGNIKYIQEGDLNDDGIFAEYNEDGTLKSSTTVIPTERDFVVEYSKEIKPSVTVTKPAISEPFAPYTSEFEIPETPDIPGFEKELILEVSE